MTHDLSPQTWDAIDAVVLFRCQRCGEWVPLQRMDDPCPRREEAPADPEADGG